MPLAPIQNNSQSIGLEDLELEPRYEYQEKYTESQLDSLVAAILSKNPTIDKVQSIDKDIHYSERNKKRQGKCGLDQDGNLRNPLYLDANGVTIKARKCNRDMIGEKWELNGVEYEIVDNESLRELVKNEKDVSKVVTTFVTNLNRLFHDRQVLYDITSWDTSQVTDMGYLFYGQQIFNQDIGNWNTSQVNNMVLMFRSARDFNKDIGNWDTSQVQVMYEMFHLAESFNQDISNWDTIQATELFANDERLIKHDNGVTMMLKPNLLEEEKKSLVGKKLRFELDRYTIFDESLLRSMIETNQDVSLVITSLVTDMSEMFYKAESFNQDVSHWDVINVIDMNAMFYYGRSFNQDIGDWNVSGVTDMSSMFQGAESFNQDISGWDVSRLTTCFGFYDSSELSQENLPAFTKCNF